MSAYLVTMYVGMARARNHMLIAAKRSGLASLAERARLERDRCMASAREMKES